MPGAHKRRVEGERLEQPLHKKKPRKCKPKSCEKDNDDCLLSTSSAGAVLSSASQPTESTDDDECVKVKVKVKRLSPKAKKSRRTPNGVCRRSTSSAGKVLPKASKPTKFTKSSAVVALAGDEQAPVSPMQFFEEGFSGLETPEDPPAEDTLSDHDNILKKSLAKTTTSARIGTQQPRNSDFQLSDLLHIGSDDDDDGGDDEFNNRFDTFTEGRQIPLDGTYVEDIIPELNESSPSKNDEQSDRNGLFDFNWRPFSEDAAPPTERREKFTEVPGPVRKFTSPYKAFVAIWDDKIMELLVAETNRYAYQIAEEKMANSSMAPGSRITMWQDTTKDELMLYLGLLMAMSLCFKGQVQEYWGENGTVSETPNFKQYMSYNRFVLLNKCLHFRNNVEIANLIIADKQLSGAEIRNAKIEPIVRHLNSKFQSLYSLSQDIVIYESLVQRKQNTNDKSAGIKTVELCDSKKGYLWRFEMYADVDHTAPVQSSTTSPLDTKTNKLVLRMLKGLESTHRTVWMDNNYNSPVLARHLKSLGLDCAGTLRTNLPFVPDGLKYLKTNHMIQGELVACTSGDVDVMVWRDKNRVAMISTYHGIGISNAAKKPIVVLDYNAQMGVVDRKNELLSQYPIERKRGLVWYKKLFRRLLNASVTNAYILMTESGNSIQHRNFRKSLRDEILSLHSPQAPAIVPLRFPIVIGSKNRAPHAVFSKDMIRHFPKQHKKNPEGGSKEGRYRRTCIVCHQRISTYCPGCNVPLCAFAKSEDENSCFVRHHVPTVK